MGSRGANYFLLFCFSAIFVPVEDFDEDFFETPLDFFARMRRFFLFCWISF